MLLRTTSVASGSGRAAFIRLLTLLVAFLVTSAAAADNQGGPTILNNTSKYAYLGCYNETSGLANTSGARTLDNGINKVWPGNMTVEACLKVCETSGSSPYKYAGLEFSRECWCSQVLNSNADKFPDSTCNLGCDGNSTIVCGGNLKLTVYQLSAAHSVQIMYGVSTLILVGAVALNLL